MVDLERVCEEIEDVIGLDVFDVVFVFVKFGIGIEDILE